MISGNDRNTFLIPSRLWVEEGAICSLRSKDSATLMDKLKVRLFDDLTPWTPNDGQPGEVGDAEAAAAAYLALVLVRVREWFMNSQVDVIGHFTSFNWSVNLGVPSPHVGDNSQSRRFLRVGAAAWELSERIVDRGGDTIALQEATDCLERRTIRSQNGSESRLTCDLEIVPEIVAAAVGYARSNQRNDGLHMMIDVGASTMDVCSFLLGTHDGDDQYALCTADVELLGTLAYEGRPRAEVQNLKARCRQLLRRVIRVLLTRKAPNEPVWTRGQRLPVLLIGGGSRLEFFQDQVVSLGSAIRYSFKVPSDGVARPQLPVPETITHNKAEFYRLAVAWGLSYRADDIGIVIPPEQVGTVEPIRRSFRSMLTKDEM